MSRPKISFYRGKETKVDSFMHIFRQEVLYPIYQAGTNEPTLPQATEQETHKTLEMRLLQDVIGVRVANGWKIKLRV